MSGVEKSKLDQPALRVAFATLVVVAALLLRQLLQQHSGAGLPPFITFFPAVMIIAMLCGFRIGLYATAVSALLADYWIFPPFGKLAIASRTEALSLAIFIGMCILVSGVAGRHRRHQRRIAALEKERVLQQSEERFRALVTASTDAVCLMSADWTRMRQLQGRDLIPGTDPPESDWIEKYVHPDDRALMRTAIAEAIRAQSKIELEHRVVHTDSSQGWTLSRAIPLKNAKGEIVEWLATASDITERKRAEARLRRFFETDLFAILHWKIDGVVVDVNDRFLEMTGYTREDLRAGLLNWAQITPPEYQAADEDARRQIRDTGVHRPYEKEFIRKDGARVWGLFSAAAYEDDRREGISLILDVTERRWAEEALHKSEARFRSVLEDSRDLMYRMNLQTGRFEYISPSAEAVLGYSRSELAEFNLEGMIAQVHPDDLSALQSAWARLEEAGKEEMEYRQRFKDGNYHWVSNYMSLVRDSAGRPLYRDGNIRDITDKKQAVEALRESEAAYRALFENNMDAIFLCVPDGTILSANPAACAMFGMTSEELCCGGRPSRVADPKLNRALADRSLFGKFKGELTLVRKDDTEFIGEVSSVMLPGEHPRSFVIVRDITERRRAEQALIRSEKLASVGRMAATVAHEINNPLAAVTNLLFLAQQTQGMPEPARHYLEMVDAELKRIAHITRQSLGFYRESDTASIVSLNEVLESAVDLMKSKIKAKRAVIERDWEGDAEVTALPGELRQVFSNLMANSLDAIDQGGTIKLRISTAGPDFKNGHRRIRVTIADNGRGIGPSSRKHIFEPFFTTKGAVGTGLGLWVTKQIVDKHSGTIHVRSCTGGARRGTVFSVVLRVDPATPAVA
ncbi:MAG: PAS domain S-box protein [Terracidiphilus sp.]